MIDDEIDRVVGPKKFAVEDSEPGWGWSWSAFHRHIVPNLAVAVACWTLSCACNSSTPQDLKDYWSALAPSNNMIVSMDESLGQPAGTMDLKIGLVNNGLEPRPIFAALRPRRGWVHFGEGVVVKVEPPQVVRAEITPDLILIRLPEPMKVGHAASITVSGIDISERAADPYPYKAVSLDVYAKRLPEMIKPHNYLPPTPRNLAPTPGR